MNKKLYTARKQRHWSQEEAAERCEVSRTTYIRWEQDGQYPRGYNLAKACEAFNMTPEDVGFTDASIEEPIVQRMPEIVEVEGHYASTCTAATSTIWRTLRRHRANAQKD